MAGERTDTQIILSAVQDVKEHLGEKVQTISERIDVHDRVVFGKDGEPGLVEGVRDITRRFAMISRVLWVVATAILTAWGTYMFQTWVEH